MTKMRQIVYDRLKEVARRKQLITYKELAAAAGLDWNKDYGRCRQIFSILRAICTAEVEQGRPMLAAVVVRQDNGMPGAGFFALARQLGRYQGGADHSFWLAERDAVNKGVEEGRSPSYITTSPSPLKERGIKGVR
jgi:hypothetical protein